MATPFAKRRRLDNKAVNKPFKSPFRTPSQPPALRTATDTARSKSSIGTGIPAVRADDHSLILETRKKRECISEDPEIAAEEAKQRILNRKITALRQEIDE